MEPSDLEYEIGSQGIVSFPYEGATALEDVSQAYNAARTQGIIPVGIVIKPKDTQRTNRITKGRINPAVLAKLKERRAKTESTLDNAMIVRNFQRNFRTIDDLSTLPQALKEIYLRLSFGF